MALTAENLARSIVQRLHSARYTAYFAGGCVRDQLMGRVPKDFDVATSARPEEVLALFPRSQKVGVAFGVVLVREKPRGQDLIQVEVATFRADSTYSDGRHPDSIRFTDAREDAGRRDFTCNGLFFDPLANELHDFVGGQQDIQQKILRAIGDPRQRFAEDHLRMLRAIRFAAKLDFQIDSATLAAIQELAPNIKTVSKERIHDELTLILAHPTRARAAQLLQSTGLLDNLWPSELITESGRGRWLALEQLPPHADFVMALIALLRDSISVKDDAVGISERSASNIAVLLRQAFLLSNTETDDLLWLLEQSGRLFSWQHWSKAQFKRVIADPRWPRLESLFSAHRLTPVETIHFKDRISQLQSEGVAPEPFISGDDLIKLGATPGPAFKKWLDQLYDRQLEGELTSRDQALAAAKQLIAARADT